MGRTIRGIGIVGGFFRSGPSWVLAAALSACGGGGDGGNNGNEEPPPPPPAAETSASLSRTMISITDTPSSAYNSSLVQIVIRDPPDAALFVGAEHSADSIDRVTLTRRSETRTDLEIQFKPGAALEDGGHEDTVTVDVCYDEACERPVEGSPLEIAISFTVITPLSVSLANANLQIDGKTTESFEPSASAQILLEGPPVDGPFYQVTSSYTGIVDVSVPNSTPTGQPIDIVFRRPGVIGAGVFEDDITVKVCYDSDCTREVEGSPLAVHTTLTVLHDAIAEPGVAPLAVASRMSLTHDVIDAQYSATLDAIVMVASWPHDALYVYYTATGIEQELALTGAPTAVSLAPNGLAAAVGHDGFITHIGDLSLIGQPSPPAPTLLHVSAKAQDLVLDGNGYVHVFPEDYASHQLHSVEVATDTEQLIVDLVNREAQAHLDPTGNFLYDQDNGFSELLKIDIASGTPALAYASTVFDTHQLCTGLWPGETDDNLYTGCGTVVSTSTTQAQDMAYVGTLAVEAGVYLYKIRSLSDSAETHEVAAIETPLVDCFSDQNYQDCYSHIAAYDSITLTRSALYSIPPVNLGDEKFAEHGLFIFHSSNGTARYLISRLAQREDHATEYYLSVL